MIRKLVALVALAVGTVLAFAAPAVAEPYSPIIPTEVIITITANGPGEAVVVSVRAGANSTQQPTGDIDIQISQGSGAARAGRSVVAAPIYTKTVRFEGKTVQFAGPKLPTGNYLAGVQFSPDDSGLFLPSDNTFRFRIAAAGGGGNGGGAADGGLPNTGGPDLMWLLLGAGLVAAGAGGVTYGRRRQGSPA